MKVNGEMKNEPYGHKILEDLIVKAIFLGGKGRTSLAAAYANEFGDDAQVFNPIPIALLALAATAVMCPVFSSTDRH